MEAKGGARFPKSDIEVVAAKFAGDAAVAEAVEALPDVVADEAAFYEVVSSEMALQEAITLAREARRRAGAPGDSGPFAKAALQAVLAL